MTTLAIQPGRVAAWRALRAHWRIYAIDGALLGLFMVAACVSTIVLEHPSFPVRHWIGSGFARRALGGICMGLTAIALIYSRWGKRSGAFMNPAMIAGFYRLGRISLVDALGYIAGQLIGSALGVGVCVAVLGHLVRDESVAYVVTTPGPWGAAVAWFGEFIIALVMMITVMGMNKRPTLAPFTGYVAATLVFLYITFEAPLSGMSLNPARTFGSALLANQWTGWWIYLTAPVLGMLAGIELHRLITSGHQSLCGKLSHSRHVACFIQCNCLNEQQEHGS